MLKTIILSLTILHMAVPFTHAMDQRSLETSDSAPIKVCVFCSANDQITNYKQATFALGEELAKAGATLVTGGSNSGLMKEVVDGFATVNKENVYGILPQVLKPHKITHPAIPPEHLIWTTDMGSRLKTFHDHSNACIVLPGGWGTLHELMDFLVSDQFGIHKTNIILANFGGFWDPLMNQFSMMMDKNALFPEHFDSLKMANNIVEVLYYLKNKEGKPHHSGLEDRYWEKEPNSSYDKDSSPNLLNEDDDQLIFHFSYDK